VLLIEDNPIDAAVTGRRLFSAAPTTYVLTTVASLGDAWPLLEAESVDVVLTDLNLPDSQGLDTLAALRARVPHVPIVVLTGVSDQGTGIRAVQMGAQDYLEKGAFDGRLVQRAVLYAIERHRLVQTLHDLSLLDPLTGLYNRRGLHAVAGKRMAVALRVGCRAFVLFADLDDLKDVNDRFGHAAGDAYIQLAAEALRQSFRAADVLGRVGGDEFVVLGLEASSFDLSLLITRVQRALERLGREHQLPYAAAISCGMRRFDPSRTEFDNAIHDADIAMYETKRVRRGESGPAEAVAGSAG
jgi:diguanylate cyclase (GGDEF)-like protein